MVCLKKENYIILYSVYKEVLDKKMAYLSEAGLPTKYYKYEMDKVASLNRGNIYKIFTKPLSLAHLSGPFMMLAILLAIDIFVFLMEFGIHRL